MNIRISYFTNRLLKAVENLISIIGITFLMLILGHFAIGGIRYIKHSFMHVKMGEALQEELKANPVFFNYEGFPSYFQDAARASAMEVHPYYHWRRKPASSKTVNVDAQATRHTIKYPKIGAKKIFMFGASTMWGTGSPDQYTIPSQLQALLGTEYDVYNFGETAYVSVQELNLLLEQLSMGFIPDMVIFYDGASDGYASLYSPGRPRHPQFTQEDYKGSKSVSDLLLDLINRTNYIALTVRLNKLLKRDDESNWELKIMPQLDHNAKEVIQNYAHFIKQVKALGLEYGFKTYHFWQPLLLTERGSLTEFESKIVNSTSQNLIQSYTVLYQLAQKELSHIDNFYYIADVFENNSDPIYFDFCHMGPMGNQIIANKMYELVFGVKK